MKLEKREWVMGAEIKTEKGLFIKARKLGFGFVLMLSSVIGYMNMYVWMLYRYLNH